MIPPSLSLRLRRLAECDFNGSAELLLKAANELDALRKVKEAAREYRRQMKESGWATSLCEENIDTALAESETKPGATMAERIVAQKAHSLASGFSVEPKAKCETCGHFGINCQCVRTDGSDVI
jgi:hypothetical protein